MPAPYSRLPPTTSSPPFSPNPSSTLRGGLYSSSGLYDQPRPFPPPAPPPLPGQLPVETQDSFEDDIAGLPASSNHSGVGLRGFNRRASPFSDEEMGPDVHYERPKMDEENSLIPPSRGYENRGSDSNFEPGKGEKFPLTADPGHWGAETQNSYPEPDDYLHNPDPKRDRRRDNLHLWSLRGIANVGCLVLIATALFGMFAGFPIISHYLHPKPPPILGVNSTGQMPIMPGNWGLIDRDTPKSAYSKSSYTYGKPYDLVFSDEFNVDDRTFYPGDDPYWEAVDLHYWQTGNLEWYDPEAVTTKGGNLVITLEKKQTHGLDYQGGLLSTWNKFCFTGGILEVNATLPGASNINGLWPAIWAMGNLGRAGYGASLESNWPYSYDSCDVGTLANQTYPDGTPTANTVGGDPGNGGALSYLEGQRLSACTCPNDPTHPGPKKSDGTWTGRSSPEIDVFEATVNSDTLLGYVSQSAQWAPFDAKYTWDESSGNYAIYDTTKTQLNSYKGGAFQQASSALVLTNQACWEQSGGCASIYGFEYQPGNDGFITWISEGVKSWTIMQTALGPDSISGASQRLVSTEPMYVIMNLGISPSFGPISPNLQLPVHFLIDYVRIYQPRNSENVGCDPSSRPTAAYINQFPEAYTNANLTTWAQYGKTKPKNRLVDTC